jgi:lipocalin
MWNRLNKDYVVSEILDTVSLMQLNKENVPVLENTQIEDIAERYLFEWNEVGDYEADFSRGLLEFLREEFDLNKINYKFNG